MTTRIGINGFGRIGRMVFRAIIKEFQDEFEIVGINDLIDPDYLAYMLKHDSVHGGFDGDIKVVDGCLLANGKRIRLTAEKDPSQLRWSDVGAEIIFECTGRFLNSAECSRHIHAGARVVIISAPSNDSTPMFVYGVNHQSYDSQTVISAASCTTNCLAPIAKVLNDFCGIKRGLMTTVHAVTAGQKTVDTASHRDWRSGRGILENIIPASTGAAKAVGAIIPELNGKVTGTAFRVPISDVSVVDFTVELENPATFEVIKSAIRDASTREGIGETLGVTHDQVVSTDFRGNSYSSIFDEEASFALDESFIKIIAWYDNEYGYTCNMLRLSRFIAGR